jgi:acid phosphatase type 7
MVAWLDQDLKNTRKPWKIAYWHQSPYDPYRGNDYENTAARERFVPLMEKYGVQVVFSGHYHAYSRTVPILRGQEAPLGQGTVYIISGGGGAILHGVYPSLLAAVTASEYHYLSAEFLQGSLVIRAIRLDGSVLDTVTIAPPPSSISDSVVNGASFMPLLAPGSVISIFGQFLAPRSGSAGAFPLPEEIANAQVTLNDAKLPLFFASSSQVNAQLPFEAQGPATLRISTPAGSSETQINIGKAGPGIFNLTANTPAVIRPDGSLVSELNPALPGEDLSIFGTGLGRISGRMKAGMPAPSAPLLTVVDPVQVLFDDVTVVPSFAGLAPGYVGLYQVNVRVPATAASGSVALRLVVSGVHSNTVTLFVR